MDPEEFEELVARAGGTCTRKPTGYAVDRKPREQLWPRTHEWIGLDDLPTLTLEPSVLWSLRDALLLSES